MNVRKGLFSIVEKNKLAAEAGNAYDEMAE